MTDTNETTTGNMVKMREALEYAQEMLYVDCNGEVHICANDVKRISDKIKAALAEPARNCDVGTADEHTFRFRDAWERANGERVPQVGLHLASQFSRWAQMPYKGEENNDT